MIAEGNVALDNVRKGVRVNGIEEPMVIESELATAT